MTACEKGEAIDSRIDVCNQVGAVCRIVMTLKALRMEDRRDAILTPRLPAVRCENIPPPLQPITERPAPEAPPKP
jgi:hypothetical protein